VPRGRREIVWWIRVRMIITTKRWWWWLHVTIHGEKSFSFPAKKNFFVVDKKNKQ
jgi:hypothetical protein